MQLVSTLIPLQSQLHSYSSVIVATEIVTNSRPTLSEPVFLSVFTSPSCHLFQPLFIH